MCVDQVIKINLMNIKSIETWLENLDLTILHSIAYEIIDCVEIVLFGTFIKTEVALIHGFSERILSVKPDFFDSWRPMIANQIGLIELKIKSYGALTWEH